MQATSATLDKPAPAAHQRAARPRSLLAGLALIVVLVGAGALLPKWLTFLLTMAASHGLVSLGIVVLMRCGVVSFGQGMVFALGGYTAALLFNRLGMTDALGMALAGGVVAALAALLVARLIAGYRGIFFAMLTLALSMVLYGVLVKTDALGGSDGFNMSRPTLLGQALPDAHVGFLLYAVTVTLSGLLALAARVYFDSTRGLVSLAVRENELRVEYLGGSVRQAVAANFVIAAFLGGVGGALTVMSLGHIDPNFSYWTSSGEFVFVAILAGYHSVLAVFIASTLLEIVRSFSSLYFPNTWQLALGIFLLLAIRFLPGGIGSLWAGGKIRTGSGGRQ
ncbi:branched-chain amino acid ABC transporter permease|uniref:branched-chain amino acid ABC transporter permease n=1 Tax=Noviherbaspirillum sp. L7-7A TaxID=2850560 RepID=UPI001C2B7B7D|nr:branched-chain amino acid ABC transporter permease [Noviherbaspirillum sp. L7-7A]MBV0879191.1 branched-chain amino acid ABC transporter permease [Noviherbaspirillum sp. L7-7A]